MDDALALQDIVAAVSVPLHCTVRPAHRIGPQKLHRELLELSEQFLLPCRPKPGLPSFPAVVSIVEAQEDSVGWRRCICH